MVTLKCRFAEQQCSRLKLKMVRGFTLIELMVTVAVLVVVITVGLPNFMNFIQRYFAESAIGMFHKDLQLARAEAVSLGQRVTVCHLSNDGKCDGEWLQGISVFVDSGANLGQLDADELVLAASNPLGIENTFKSATRNRVTFSADGQAAGFAATFIFCPSSGEAEFARGVILSNTGRARSTKDNDSDGIHEGADGTPLSCS